MSQAFKSARCGGLRGRRSSRAAPRTVMWHMSAMMDAPCISEHCVKVPCCCAQAKGTILQSKLIANSVLCDVLVPQCCQPDENAAVYDMLDSCRHCRKFKCFQRCSQHQLLRRSIAARCNKQSTWSLPCPTELQNIPPCITKRTRHPPY